MSSKLDNDLNSFSAPFEQACSQKDTNYSFINHHNINNVTFGLDGFRLTTVREPMSHFFSVYNFFYYKFTSDSHDECDIECFGKVTGVFLVSLTTTRVMLTN